jgi:hypothetical protein
VVRCAHKYPLALGKRFARVLVELIFTTRDIQGSPGRLPQEPPLPN